MQKKSGTFLIKILCIKFFKLKTNFESVPRKKGHFLFLNKNGLFYLVFQGTWCTNVLIWNKLVIWNTGNETIEWGLLAKLNNFTVKMWILIHLTRLVIWHLAIKTFVNNGCLFTRTLRNTILSFLNVIIMNVSISGHSKGKTCLSYAKK